ncbi:MAG TPA: hypothetical protein VFW46_09140 [Stellaceae bacterium]|nr:hypothetical protein [Stellaceae bacterium]
MAIAFEKMERKGGTVSWATECTTPQGTIRSEGTAHYGGDRMVATFKSRTAQGGTPPWAMLNGQCVSAEMSRPV